MKKRHVVVMGLGFGLAGCGSKSSPEAPIATNPPEAVTGGTPEGGGSTPEAPPPAGDGSATPEGGATPEPDYHANPPPAPSTGYPEWDAVASGHPPGATNPPMAILVMTPDRACYKTWVSPMAPKGGMRGDRVEDPLVTTDGTRVECPEPRASQVLDAWKAAGSPANPLPSVPGADPVPPGPGVPPVKR